LFCSSVFSLFNIKHDFFDILADLIMYFATKKSSFGKKKRKKEVENGLFLSVCDNIANSAS